MAKVLKYGLLVVVLLLLLAFLLPWLFKDEIFQKIKSEANANLNGELVIEDLNLSLFSHFPNLTLSLEGVSFSGIENFENKNLFKADQIKAELDLMSVFNGDEIKVNEVLFSHLHLHVLVLEDGEANYLIMKESGSEPEEKVEAEETVEPSAFNLSLKTFRIEESSLHYEDKSGDILADLKDINLTLSGNFDEVVTSVLTQLSIAEFSIASEGVNYLNKTNLVAEIEASYNSETGKVDFGENAVSLNNLGLNFKGWILSADEFVDMDLTFSTPTASFKDALSLIPAIYLHDYQDVKVSGDFELNGNASGKYVYETEALPAFNLDLNVAKGLVKYPDLPSDISSIEIDGSISNTGGSADLTVVNLQKAAMNIAGSPFLMTLKMSTPISDPNIDLTIKSKLDLGKLPDAIKLDDYPISGMVEADASISGALSDYENENYADVKAKGYFKSGHLKIGITGVNESVLVDTVYTSISPKKLLLKPLKLTIGQSDFTGSGSLENLLSYALADDTLNGSFAIKAEYINATELMNLFASENEETTAVQEKNSEKTTESTTELVQVPANLNLVLRASADKVLYDDIELENASGRVLVKNGRLKVDGLRSDILDGSMKLDMTYELKEGKPYFTSDFNLVDLVAKTSFTTFNTIQAFAPVAESAKGTFGGSISLSSYLTSDFMPDLATLSASGTLLTKKLILQPDVMKQVSALIGNQDFSKILFQDANLSFAINDGRVEVSPVNLKLADYNATFSGSHGLDQTLDYNLKTTVPIEKVNLPKEIAALGFVKGTIPIEFRITGTLDNPNVKPVFGKADGVKELIDDLVDQVQEEIKDTLTDLANKEAERLLAEAKAEADKLKAVAAMQAKAVKAEANKQGADLKAEARKQADKLLEEAKGDPLKEFAAKTAADAVIREADKQVDKLVSEANKQADELVQKANQEADRIIKEAEEKAKIQN